MTVNDFIDDLSALGEELSDPQSILTELGSNLVEGMRSRSPVDTGALKNSINYAVNGNELSFSMLYYGMFQNYGVSGTEDSLGSQVPFGITPTPSNGSNYAFTTRRFGLRPRSFFNYDQLTETISASMADELSDF